MVAPPNLGRAPPAYLPAGTPPDRVCARSPYAPSFEDPPSRPAGAAMALEDLLGLPHEVAHNRQLVGLEALGHFAHLLGNGLLETLQPLSCRRDDLDPDSATVLGVAAPGHHARLFQPVQDEGHRPRGQSALFGQVTGGHRAQPANQIQTAQVGPAELQVLGHALVEVAGCAQYPMISSRNCCANSDRDHCLDT